MRRFKLEHLHMLKQGINVDEATILHISVIHGGVLPGARGTLSHRYTQPITGSTYDGQRWDCRYIHKQHNYGSYPSRVQVFLF